MLSATLDYPVHRIGGKFVRQFQFVIYEHFDVHACHPCKAQQVRQGRLSRPFILRGALESANVRRV